MLKIYMYLHDVCSHLMVLQRMSGGREWGVGRDGAILQNKHTDILKINTIRLKISMLMKHAINCTEN